MLLFDSYVQHLQDSEIQHTVQRVDEEILRFYMLMLEMVRFNMYMLEIVTGCYISLTLCCLLNINHSSIYSSIIMYPLLPQLAAKRNRAFS